MFNINEDVYTFDDKQICIVFETNERLFWNFSWLHCLRKYPKCLCYSPYGEGINYWRDSSKKSITRIDSFVLDSIYNIISINWNFYE